MPELRTYLALIAKHAIATTGGRVFGAAFVVWAVLQYHFPDHKVPSLQLWTLFVISVGFFYYASYQVWKREYALRLHADHALLDADHELEAERERSRQFNIEVETANTFFTCSDNPPQSTSPPSSFWVLCPDVVITNRSDRPLPLRLAIYFGVLAEGAWRTGNTCESDVPGWVLRPRHRTSH
jgi:hypothetical protein